MGSKDVDHHDSNVLVAPPAKAVAVFFHSDRYVGPCRLIPASSSKEEPPDGYPTGDILPVPDDEKKRRACFVLSEKIPAGLYFVEVKLKGKNGELRPIYPLVAVSLNFIDRSPATGKSVGGNPSVPLAYEGVIGDGISLEESYYNLFSYCLEDSVGRLLEEDAKGSSKEASGGEEKKSWFKTLLGVAGTSSELLASAIGLVRIEFGIWKSLKSLDKFLGSKGSDRLLKLWQKSGVAGAQLDWTKKLKEPNVLGKILMTGEEGEILVGAAAQEARSKLTYLEAFEKTKIDDWRAKLDRSSKFQKVGFAAEVLGATLEAVNKSVDTLNFLAAFREADRAQDKFRGNLSYHCKKIVDPRRKPPQGPREEGWFVRSDMALLETLKLAADNATAAAHLEGWKWTFGMVSLVCGATGVGEALTEALHAEKVLGAAEKAQKGYEWAMKIRGIKEGYIGTDPISALSDRLAQYWHDLVARTSNDVQLRYVMLGTTNENHASYDLMRNFYVRAKVLYTLKALIDECGPPSGTYDRMRAVTVGPYNFADGPVYEFERKTNSVRFEEAVAQNRLQEYIDRFVLGKELWVRNDALFGDWVHLVLKEMDAAFSSELIRFDRPPRPEGWVRVDWQRYWPIHFMDHPNATEFAKSFATRYGDFNADDIESCLLQYGKARWVKPERGGDALLEIESWEALTDAMDVDSETPVRAVLVLKKDANAFAGIPAQFQVIRTDGFNVPGPIYRTAIRKVGEADMLPQLADRFVAVAEFSYAYKWGKRPVKIYQGLKPVLEKPSLSSWKTWAFPGYMVQREAVHKGWPQTMTFAVRWAVADGRRWGYAETKGFFNSTCEISLVPKRTTAPPDATFEERNREKFTTLSFLHRQVAEAPSEEPPKPKIVETIVQRKEGESWTSVKNLSAGVGVTDALRVILVVDKPVEACPAILRVVRTDGSNTEGPRYVSEVCDRLDSLGSSFQGKWGYVFTPDYYYVSWYCNRRPVEIRGVEHMLGIKPVVGRIHRGHAEPVKLSHYDGYTFALYYGVGTADPSQATNVVKIPPSWSPFNDVPLKMDREYMKEWFTGSGVLCVAWSDTPIIVGEQRRGATMRLVGQRVRRGDDGNIYDVTSFDGEMNELADVSEEYLNLMMSADPA